MLGEQKSNFYTVKDISAADFINAFAQYLKKNNLIERPKWADVVKTSTGTFSFIQPTNSPPSTTTGSTTELPHSLVKSTSGPGPESTCSPTSTARSTESPADTPDTSTQAQRSSDGACSSWRSKK